MRSQYLALVQVRESSTPSSQFERELSHRSSVKHKQGPLMTRHRWSRPNWPINHSVLSYFGQSTLDSPWTPTCHAHGKSKADTANLDTEWWSRHGKGSRKTIPITEPYAKDLHNWIRHEAGLLWHRVIVSFQWAAYAPHVRCSVLLRDSLTFIRRPQEPS